MICYVLAMGKQHLGPHVVVGYGIKIFWPGLFITSPDHLVTVFSVPKGTEYNGIPCGIFLGCLNSHFDRTGFQPGPIESRRS